MTTDDNFNRREPAMEESPQLKITLKERQPRASSRGFQLKQIKACAELVSHSPSLPAMMEAVQSLTRGAI